MKKFQKYLGVVLLVVFSMGLMVVAQQSGSAQVTPPTTPVLPSDVDWQALAVYGVFGLGGALAFILGGLALGGKTGSFGLYISRALLGFILGAMANLLPGLATQFNAVGVTLAFLAGFFGDIIFALLRKNPA